MDSFEKIGKYLPKEAIPLHFDIVSNNEEKEESVEEVSVEFGDVPLEKIKNQSEIKTPSTFANPQ